MADSIFDFVAEKLEEATDLGKLESRGTVRIALKQAGLDARSVTRHQMQVMLERTMPAELAASDVPRRPLGRCWPTLLSSPRRRVR